MSDLLLLERSHFLQLFLLWLPQLNEFSSFSIASRISRWYF